jgi:spore germination protein KB
MIRLSKHQLFTLMFIFEVGSTTLFALGIKAKQDAWIVILVALLIGLVFIWIYTELQKAFPDKNYVEIIIAVLGKKIGIPLSLLYAVHWLWPAARNLREFGEMIIITSLQETPLSIVLFIFILISLYALLSGLEVLGRTSEIIMPIVLFFMVSLYIMIAASGVVELNRIKPILGEGIKPVLEFAYPDVAIFPFGEIFIFSMYWCYCNDKKSIRKVTISATVLSGILLSMSLVTDVAVLGVENASIATIPFMEVIRTVRITDAITNIDAIGVMIIFLGGFYKMSLFLDGIVLVLVTVFKKFNYNATLIFTSFFLLIVSIIFEPSYIYHKWMYPFDSNYFYTPFLHVIPTTVLVIYWIKRKRAQM